MGAEPLAERSGHTFIRTRMYRTGALFGAEVSGHFFFRELEGGDDGMLAACRIIAHLAQTGQSLAELRRLAERVHHARSASKPRCRRQRTSDPTGGEAWAEHPQSTVDGLRVDLPGGWALVRRSVTEPALTFRFESADWHGLEHLVGSFCGLLPEVGPKLWTCYKSAMGTHDVGV